MAGKVIALSPASSNTALIAGDRCAECRIAALHNYALAKRTLAFTQEHFFASDGPLTRSSALKKMGHLVRARWVRTQTAVSHPKDRLQKSSYTPVDRYPYRNKIC